MAVPPGGSATYAVPVDFSGRAAGAPGQLQVALRTNQQLDPATGRPAVFYFAHQVS